MSTTHVMVQSPVGELILVAEEGTLSGVYFPDHWDEARSGHVRRAHPAPARTGRGAARGVLRRRAHGLRPASELGTPTLARRVGNAVGRNPLSVIVPCHRVVGNGGKLPGYAGGLERKRFLLDLEAAA